MARKGLNLGLHRPKRVPYRSRKEGRPKPRKGFIPKTTSPRSNGEVGKVGVILLLIYF